MKSIIPTLHLPKEKNVIAKKKEPKNSFDAGLFVLGWKRTN